MYSRAERKFLRPDSDHANPNLGPGCYTVDEPTLIAGKILGDDGYAPFSSLAPRVSAFDEMVTHGPAPGTYEIPVEVFTARNLEKSSVFGKSRCARFDDDYSDTPGPGSYLIPSTIVLARTSKSRRSAVPKIPAHPLTQQPVPAVTEDGLRHLGESVEAARRTARAIENVPHAALALSAKSIANDGSKPANDQPKENFRNTIEWKRKHVPPSIPIGQTAFGYQENDDGTLEPRKPSRKSIDSGPAYNFNTSFVERAKHDRRGFKFSKDNHRLQYTSTISPGPGAYEASSERKHAAGNGAALMTLAPCVRITDSILADATKKSIPGPGAYEIKATLEEDLHRKKGRINFGAGNKRVACYINSTQLENPGPGEYYPETGSSQKPMSFKPQPFGSTTTRFSDAEERKRSAPAPGSYDVTIPNGRRSQRVQPNMVRPFGSLGGRFRREKRNLVPGPGAYNIESPNFGPLLSEPSGKGKRASSAPPASRRPNPRGASSVFNSLLQKGPYKIILGGMQFDPSAVHVPVFGTQMQRFPDPIEAKAVPPPGAYEVSKAYQELVSKGKLGNETMARAAMRGELFVVKRDAPGPGEYEPTIVGKKEMNRLSDQGFLTTDQRFEKLPKEKVPGPGTYLSTDYDSGLLRKTFNVTLKTQ
ncbi:hypothetical protein BJ742DRAFT_295594 [Cladochytrium replicatum]|nr:hypothetical protein BJ742DRAFT_295594 [Cladochytrium replicatum]